MGGSLRTQTELDLARLHSAMVWGLEMSRDPVWKVGASLVAADGRRVSMGFNGLVKGLPETAENWTKERKLKRVRHAEVNAMAWAQFDKNGSTLYCPLRPCSGCLGDAVNCGVQRVVWLEDPNVADDGEYYGDEWQEFAGLVRLTVHTMTSTTIRLLAAYGLCGTMKNVGRKNAQLGV